MDVITNAELNRATLARQWLLEPVAATAVDAVEQLAGMQAQEAKPPFIGLWTRLREFTRNDLSSAIRSRSIVRVTAMRCTLHLMSTRDYLAYRTTLQPALSSALQSILGTRLDGVDREGLVAMAREYFQTPATFDDLRDHLTPLYPDRDIRALAYAVRGLLPLVMVATDDPWAYPGAANFTPVESWLGDSPDPIDAVDSFALRYLRAFGPASVGDFQAWSGLNAAAAVFRRLEPQLVTFKNERGRTLYDHPEAPRPLEETPAPVRFLPEFDNVLLAYSDRTRIIADEHRPHVMTKNGRVNGTYLVDGIVAGMWAMKTAKQAVRVTLTPFHPLADVAREELASQGESLARFIDPKSSSVSIEFETV